MKDGISYHSKDILFKSLSEWYPNTSLEVYGLLMACQKLKRYLLMIFRRSGQMNGALTHSFLWKTILFLC